MRAMMGRFGVGLAVLAVSASGYAQEKTEAAKPEAARTEMGRAVETRPVETRPMETRSMDPRPMDPRPVKTIFLPLHSWSANDGNEVLTALRLLLDPSVKLYLTPASNAITIRARPEEIAQAEQLIAELDRPRPAYRLTYTVNETDGGKRVGSQNYAIVMAPGGRTTLKAGSKVPVATGTFDTGEKSQQTQFTYIDLGLNIDATLEEFAGGMRLKEKIEQSSVADERTIAGVTEPLIRQTVTEGTSFLTVGKPQVVAAVDVPGSTRHLEFEVVLEPVR